MISAEDAAAIDAYVASLCVDDWPAITSTERDLLRRALAPAAVDDPRNGAEAA